MSVSVAAAIAIGVVWFGRDHNRHLTVQLDARGAVPAAPAATNGDKSIELSDRQLDAIKIAAAETYEFPVDSETVGTIDFDEDVSVQVFPPYQGTIIEAIGVLGGRASKDQPLYTVRSPDLIQAESTLISAAATFELTNSELARARGLNGANGVSERELEQATSDQQTAEGALKAARDAVHVFGKTDAEIDHMIASRQIDPALVVRSPIDGTITARNAQQGVLVQPGAAPAPYAVADVTRKWMLATVPEANIAAIRPGQSLHVQVSAYPGRQFAGHITKMYESVDPNTHRVTVRSEIADPTNILRPGMLATFVIRVAAPVRSVAVPEAGVVREPDGTMTVWVTTDRRHFTPRTVKTGLRRDGRVQIIEGLRPSELVVTTGAVFLSNMLQTS